MKPEMRNLSSRKDLALSLLFADCLQRGNFQLPQLALCFTPVTAGCYAIDPEAAERLWTSREELTGVRI
jgi:hypothetical protein